MDRPDEGSKAKSVCVCVAGSPVLNDQCVLTNKPTGNKNVSMQEHNLNVLAFFQALPEDSFLQ